MPRAGSGSRASVASRWPSDVEVRARSGRGAELPSQGRSAPAARHPLLQQGVRSSFQLVRAAWIVAGGDQQRGGDQAPRGGAGDVSGGQRALSRKLRARHELPCRD